jgi:hypothetical protein
MKASAPETGPAPLQAGITAAPRFVGFRRLFGAFRGIGRATVDARFLGCTRVMCIPHRASHLQTAARGNKPPAGPFRVVALDVNASAPLYMSTNVNIRKHRRSPSGVERRVCTALAKAGISDQGRRPRRAARANALPEAHAPGVQWSGFTVPNSADEAPTEAPPETRSGPCALLEHKENIVRHIRLAVPKREG